MHDLDAIPIRPDLGPLPAEIEAGDAPQEGPGAAASGFDPLATCPSGARERYERRASLAATRALRAIELKCIECCAWSRPEASRCEIRSCPLWAMNQRVFRQGQRSNEQQKEVDDDDRSSSDAE